MVRSAFDLSEATELLNRTPGTLNALLRGLPDVWVQGTESEAGWSPFDIVGHLIFADRFDWIPRVRSILDHGDTRPFDPFDREGHVHQIAERCLEDLLDEFAEVRGQSLAVLRELNLSTQDLARPGLHPALGRVTLSQLLATWTVHDLTHLNQISRAMAHQYRDAVGPWSEYLGVLHCAGHGQS